MSQFYPAHLTASIIPAMMRPMTKRRWLADLVWWWQGLYTRCLGCGKLERVLSVRVGRHGACPPF